MRKVKKLMSGILAMGMAIALSIPVAADEAMPMSAIDFKFPARFISYSNSYNSVIRSKEDVSYNYVNNTSGFDLWVVTKAGTDKSNQTKNGHAIVPRGAWFIANYVYENGYRSCFLNVTTATSGTSGTLRGEGSPDSVGSYPVANR